MAQTVLAPIINVDMVQEKGGPKGKVKVKVTLTSALSGDALGDPTLLLSKFIKVTLFFAVLFFYKSYRTNSPWIRHPGDALLNDARMNFIKKLNSTKIFTTVACCIAMLVQRCRLQ